MVGLPQVLGWIVVIDQGVHASRGGSLLGLLLGAALAVAVGDAADRAR